MPLVKVYVAADGQIGVHRLLFDLQTGIGIDVAIYSCSVWFTLPVS